MLNTELEDALDDCARDTEDVHRCVAYAMSEVVTASVDCQAHIDKLRVSAKASVTCVYGQS